MFMDIKCLGVLGGTQSSLLLQQHLVIQDLDLGKVAQKDNIACCNI